MIDAPQPPHKSSGFTEDTRELRGVVAPAATLKEREGEEVGAGGRRWRVEGVQQGAEEEVAPSSPLFLAACSCAAHKQEI